MGTLNACWSMKNATFSLLSSHAYSGMKGVNSLKVRIHTYGVHSPYEAVA